jgi:hypothetical protein
MNVRKEFSVRGQISRILQFVKDVPAVAAFYRDRLACGLRITVFGCPYQRG